jgi:hypothetical protein
VPLTNQSISQIAADKSSSTRNKCLQFILLVFNFLSVFSTDFHCFLQPEVGKLRRSGINPLPDLAVCLLFPLHLFAGPAVTPQANHGLDEPADHAEKPLSPASARSSPHKLESRVLDIDRRHAPNHIHQDAYPVRL